MAPDQPEDEEEEDPLPSLGVVPEVSYDESTQGNHPQGRGDDGVAIIKIGEGEGGFG